MDRKVGITALAVQTPQFECHDKSLAAIADSFRQRGNEKRAKAFERMMARAGINQRYSVIPLASLDQIQRTGCLDTDGNIPLSPELSTGARNALFVGHASALALNTLSELGTDFSTITDLVTVSCTGFSAPGIDIEIVRTLGLPSNTQRTNLGFMGCFAGITALRTARDFVRSQRNRRVLVVCVELCSLHVQFNDDLENMLGQALFADGCATAVVEATDGSDCLATLGEARSTIVPELDGAITWYIGDRGYDLGLSAKLPNNLAKVLQRDDLFPETMASDPSQLNWIIHPGGKAIVEAVADGLALAPDRIEPSLNILREKGNMSSTTVFFVLREHLRQGRTGPGMGVAFGPGFGVEALEINLMPGGDHVA